MCYKQELAFPLNTFFNVQDNRIVVMDRNLIWSVLIIHMLPLLLQNVIQDLDIIKSKISVLFVLRLNKVSRFAHNMSACMETPTYVIHVVDIPACLRLS